VTASAGRGLPAANQARTSTRAARISSARFSLVQSSSCGCRKLWVSRSSGLASGGRRAIWYTRRKMSPSMRTLLPSEIQVARFG
jgi:hypothetical protein